MKKLLILLLVSTSMTFCNDNKKAEENTETEEMIPVEPNGGIGDGAPSLENAFAEGVEKTHNKQHFMSHQAISYDLNVVFKGSEPLDAKVTMLTNSTKIKMVFPDSSAVIYDGNNVYVTPKTSEKPMARFNIFTWPYFFALPFKLTDEGTKWGNLEQMDVNSNPYSRAKLTFEDGTGDTANDWYWVYVDNKTNLLSYASYIVTFGSDVKKAEENPHAIVYSNYTVIDDIPMADEWKFYNWSEEKGLYGDPIGDAKIRNIEFLDEADFSVPNDSKTVAMPSKK